MDEAIIVALGSNLSGDYASSEALLEAALAALSAAGLHPIAVSRWWRSLSWPDPANPPYLNGVALIRSELSPEAVLAALHRIERAFGRERTESNSPRTLDLDLVAYGRREGKHPTTPHPRAHERRFVMGPLAEIAPMWRHPGLGRTAAELAGLAGVGADAAPV